MTPTGESLIQIAESGAQLPTDPVTFRWVDSGDQKAVFWNEFFAAYQEHIPTSLFNMTRSPGMKLPR